MYLARQATRSLYLLPNRCHQDIRRSIFRLGENGWKDNAGGSIGHHSHTQAGLALVLLSGHHAAEEVIDFEHPSRRKVFFANSLYLGRFERSNLDRKSTRLNSSHL